MFGSGGQVINMPSHEAQWGLAEMTTPGKKTGKRFAGQPIALQAYKKDEIGITDQIEVDGLNTTIGKLMVNDKIPEKFRDHGVVFNKNNTRAMAKKVIMSKPSSVPGMVNTWKDLGNDFAYKNGFTIGIEDLNIKPAERSRLARYGASAIRIAKDKEALVEKLGPELNEKFVDSLTSKDIKGNSIVRMMKSGGRGDKENFRQMLGIYGSMGGPKGSTLPYINTGNFAQGMDFPEYLGSLYSGRSSIVATYKGVPLGGEFAKESVNSTIDIVISEKDCGTKNGIVVDRGDEAQLFGRYRVGQEKLGPIKSSREIRTKQVKIRSPLTCEAKSGVCQICYGLNDNVEMPVVGDNIGVHAATSLSEPVTQLLLRQFHAGAGANKELGNAYDQVRGLFFGAKNIKNQATLSEAEGKVGEITPAPAGGHLVMVENKEHFVPAARNLLVKKKKMTEALRTIYDDVANVAPHHMETAVLALTKHTRVLGSGDSLTWEVGDTPLLSTVRYENKALKRPIVHEPFFSSASSITLLKRSYLDQIGRKEIKKATQRGVAQGWTDELKSHSPLRPWLLGSSDFSVGSRGEY